MLYNSKHRSSNMNFVSGLKKSMALRVESNFVNNFRSGNLMNRNRMYSTWSCSKLSNWLQNLLSRNKLNISHLCPPGCSEWLPSIPPLVRKIGYYFFFFLFFYRNIRRWGITRNLCHRGEETWKNIDFLIWNRQTAPLERNVSRFSAATPHGGLTGRRQHTTREGMEKVAAVSVLRFSLRVL